LTFLGIILYADKRKVLIVEVLKAVKVP